MPVKKNKVQADNEPIRESLGKSPASLSKRRNSGKGQWCFRQDIEYDVDCDPDNPKTITQRDILQASNFIKKFIPPTPLMKSRCCDKLKMKVYLKMEIFHKTGSFHERGALYSLMRLNKEQKSQGVITASLGNWGMALAYQGQKLHVPVTVVLPMETSSRVVEKCEEYGATVLLHGENLAEAKKEAFNTIISCQIPPVYINGYDHPNVIAGAGTIGLEILQDLPNVDAILIPVGGGGLTAGIAAAVKQQKPETLIYGIAPNKCCCFFKAMENSFPYRTAVVNTLAESLATPTAGYNAFHTAMSLIDKMVIVDDDIIARAMLHLIEEENLVTEGAGAISLSPILPGLPILPELIGKTVVCILSGGNLSRITLAKSLDRAKIVEGRIIKVKIKLPLDAVNVFVKLQKLIGNVGCNLRDIQFQGSWFTEEDLFSGYHTFVCETRNLEHSCTLKRVMERLFPNMCHFLEEPFSPIPVCVCNPKKRL